MFLNSSLWHVVLSKMWRCHRKKIKNHTFRYPKPAANALELNDSLIPKAYFTDELSSLKTTFPCTLSNIQLPVLRANFFNFKIFGDKIFD